MALAAIAAIGAGCGDESTGGGDSGDDGGGGDKTFVLGVANGQTGYLAPFDVPILAGVKDKVAELNADGGFAGEYKIELQVADSRSDIGTTATKAQELINKGADALILACDSDPAIAGGQVAQRAEIVAFGCPSNPKQVGDQLFQMYLPERANPSVSANYALDQGWKTAATLGSPDTAYTQNGVDYFEAAFKAGGGKVSDELTFKLDQQDFAKVVQQIADSDAQVLYTTMYEPGVVTFLKQLRGAGVDIPVMGDSLDTPAVQAMGPKERADLYYTSIADTNADADAGQFIAGIGEEYGDDAANVYALLGADAVSVLNAAIEEVGNDPQKLAAEIAKLQDVEGVAGPVSYDWPGSDNTQLRTVLIKSPLGGGKTKIWQSEVPDPSTYPPLID
jgi:branched-chain amino acid transport system substrate-binding protein